MKYINIFLAGSKTLAHYRERLTLWANTKNYSYRKRNENLQINIYSFKEVGDDQDVYNQVITEKSDIILFIVEDFLGDRTREEMRIAKESFNSNNHPELWVFTKDVQPTAMHFIEGVLGRQYSVDFISAEDLVNKTSIRVEDYIKRNNLHLPESQSSQQTPKPTLLKALYVVLAVCVVAIGLLAGILVHSKDYSEPALLFSGGGSVANYIDAVTKQEDFLDHYPNSYYVHAPSMGSWTMINEEYMDTSANHKYYPIALSAAKANDSIFENKTNKQRKNEARCIVLPCKLADDTLEVYLLNIKNDDSLYIKFAEQIEDSVIQLNDLKRIIINKEWRRLYTTTKGSGTRKSYCEALDMSDEELDKYVDDIFSKYSSIQSLKHDAPIVLLGSKYYGLKNCPVPITPLTVEPVIKKPLMMYFLAYNDIENFKCQLYEYKIPEGILKFLEDIDCHDLDSVIYPRGTVRVKEESLVLYEKMNLLEVNNPIQ